MFFKLLPFLGIAILMATLPLNNDFNLYGLIIMAVFTFAGTVYAAVKRQPVLRTFAAQWHPVFYCLCGFYLLNYLGLLWTSDMRNGIRQLDSGVSMFVAPIALAFIPFGKQQTILLLRFFVWATIAFCAFGFLSYILIMPGFDISLIANAKSYSHILLMWPAHWHPSNVGCILLMSTAISISLIPTHWRGWGRLEIAFGIALPIVFCVLVGARVCMVIAPVLIGLGYIFYCRWKPWLKWGLLVAGIVGATVFAQKYLPTDKILHDHIRTDLRAMAVNAIREKPLLGWGTGAMPSIIHSEERAKAVGLETPYSDLHTFHNMYLTMVVQFGALGVVALALMLGWLLWLGLRKRDFLLLAMLTINLFQMWTEDTLYGLKGIVAFALWASLLVITQDMRLKQEPFPSLRG